MIAFLEDGKQKTGFATAIIVLFSATIIGSFVASITFQLYLLLFRKKRTPEEHEGEDNVPNYSVMTPGAKEPVKENNDFEESKDAGQNYREKSLVIEDSNEAGKHSEI